MASKDSLTEEFAFTLPRGLLDDREQLHRKGRMRLATARDEILIQNEPRARENSAYGFLIVLSLTITCLGSLSTVSPAHLENLVLQDIAYLREFYNLINQQGTALIPAQCPHCQNTLEVELDLTGELSATP